MSNSSRSRADFVASAFFADTTVGKAAANSGLKFNAVSRAIAPAIDQVLATELNPLLDLTRQSRANTAIVAEAIAETGRELRSLRKTVTRMSATPPHMYPQFDGGWHMEMVRNAEPKKMNGFHDPGTPNLPGGN